MAKEYSIIKRLNVLDKSEEVVGFTTCDDEKKLIEKMRRGLDEHCRNIYKFSYGEKMLMHLLPNISAQTINDLSARVFYTAYAVCKKNNNKESVLYMSLFKDSALKFLLKVPSASIIIKGQNYNNPNYYVKELKLVI